MEGLSYNFNKIERKKTFDVSAFVSAYYFSYKPRFVPRPETYDFSQIFLILEGEGLYTTENGTYPFSPGMMFYRPAHHTSSYKWTSENVRFGLISLVCDSEAMNALGSAPIPLFGDEIASLFDLIRTGTRVCEELRATDEMLGMRFKPDTPDVVIDFLSASIERFLCMLYCRICGVELLIDESQKSNKYIDETVFSENIKKFLEEHITEQLTISRICAEFGISQTTLMKKFRRENGQGIMDYFMNRKIAEAKRLIHGTSKSFAEIAECLGFNSANYFSRVFKAREGITPTEYSKSVSKRNVTKL
ncbi:MAG: AraC family transcriptional regulator [Ruminococcaceae bacterium]|nr:AraC family transcriptional regulator [Oscillospiraceae bacterium]